MTVSSEINKSGPWLGNNVTTAFDYAFKIVDRTHVKVIRTEGGVETVLTIDVDYDVTGVGNPEGGQILTVVAPTDEQSLTNLRAVPFTQETDLENQGAYYPETVERSLDLAAMRDQQLSERLDRSVQIPAAADPSDLDSLVADILRLKDSADNIDIVAGMKDDVQTVAEISETITENIEAIQDAKQNADTAVAAKEDAVAAKDAAVAAAASVNLPGITANTMLVDNAAGTARETKGFAAVSGLLAAPVYVSSRATLKALDPSINPVSHLTEARRSGRFVFRAGDYSTHIAADVNEGVYIQATSVAATAGAWVREFDGPIFDRWFGVLADGVEDATGSLTSGTDDTTAMQRFATFIRFNGGAHYVLDGGVRKVWPAPVAHQTFLMDIRAVDGLTIEYRNGAKIHAMYPAPNTQGPTGTIWGIIWRIEANRGLTFINPSLEQEEKLSDPTSNLIGLVQFDLSWNSFGSPVAWQSRPNRNIRVLGAYQRGGIQLFVAHQASGSTADTSAAREIFVDGYVESCYYGFVSQGGADRSIVRLSSEKCGRTLFVYNCKEIDADLLINNPIGTSGNVNITVYADSTMRQSIKDVLVRAKFRGTVQNPTSDHALVSHNFIWTGTGSLGNMTNCHVDLDVQLQAGSDVRAIGIHKYDSSGGSTAADATSRGWQLQNVTWSGFINDFTTTDAFDLFINNPLGTESFVGGGVAGCGFRNLWSAAAQKMNFDGAAIITGYGRFFFENSYFAGAFTPTNAVGKVMSINSPTIQGAGGTVTQTTSRTTGVTLNEWSGQITTRNASLAALGLAKFTVSNSVVTAKDVVLVSIASGSTTDATAVKVQRVAAGAFDIVVANHHASTAETGAIVINYQVIRGASA